MTGSVATVVFAGSLVAVFISRAFTWSGVRRGLACSRMAEAALTYGAAMLVPLSWK